MGIIRAGYVAFPISPRNSALGVANLLVKTKCVHMFVSEDLAMKTLAENALEILRSDPELSKHPKVHKLSLPTFDYLYPEEDDAFEPLSPFKCSIDTPAFILHSSGEVFHLKQY
jgi:acyl-CoA synthetase (AMP-forming)/AMP-acid ligase II